MDREGLAAREHPGGYEHPGDGDTGTSHPSKATMQPAMLHYVAAQQMRALLMSSREGDNLSGGKDGQETEEGAAQ